MATRSESVPPSSPPPIPRSLKRTASLLPAFDFDSSSPPRFSKRQALSSPGNDGKPVAGKTAGRNAAADLYPTPVPTSSLGIPPSSPPPMPSSASTARPALKRTNSMLSELRAPLTSVPSIVLPFTGESVLFGRSSISCDYQLSASRLISRVHVKAAFLPEESIPTVGIECVGWNGIKVHCQGHVWSLEKGDRFTSETVGAEIMLDVQDARVVLNWPAECRRLSEKASSRKVVSNISSSSDNIVRNRKTPPIVDSPEDWNDENVNPEQQSPSERYLKKKNSQDNMVRDHKRRARSPISSSLSFPDSPTPCRVRSSSLTIVDASSAGNPTVSIYEDEAEDIILSPASNVSSDDEEEEDNEVDVHKKLAAELFSDEAESDVEEDKEEQIEEEESFIEENTFIKLREEVESDRESEHSQNIDPSPTIRVRAPTSKPARPATEKIQLSPRKLETITTHLIDQLAFSRVSCMPLSTLCNSLPPSLSGQVTVDNVLYILRKTRCIGEVKREGKDAVGKKLEDEYYYNMEKDDCETRKQAVNDTIGNRSIRASRKVHKQYFWKKPRV